MPFAKILCSLFVTVSVVFAFSGCGSERRPEGLPKLYPCFIRVAMNGEPVDGAEVRLESDRPESKQWGSGGRTKVDGVAEIYTYGRYKGAPEGHYVVTVDKYETDTAPSKLDPGIMEAQPPRHFLHARFNDKDKSPLKIEIKAKKNPVFDVNVEPIASSR